MSFFDGNARSPVSAGVSRVGVAQYDAGLRAYMLGIYNHMTLGLAISAVVALGAFMLARSNPSVAHALYVSPLKWLIMLAPLGFVMFMSFRFDRASYPTLLGTFWAFAAVMGLSLSTWFLCSRLARSCRFFSSRRPPSAA
jgi:hypothetical protein